jgi:hypothetical protein
MMRYNHTKPAPCISHNGLLYLRALLSISMIIATIFILIVTGGESLIFLSQWSLLLTTVTFAILFQGQIKSVIMIKKDNMTLVDDETENTAAASDPNQLTIVRPYQSYKWTVFMYQLAFSLNWVVVLFFYYIFIHDVLNPAVITWWDS